MRTSKWLCAVLVLVLALTGPLASWQAMAEQRLELNDQRRTNYDTPDVYPYPGSALSAAPVPQAGTPPTDGDNAGAAVLNVVYVPGKALICTAGTLTAFAVMLITFGSGYRPAVSLFKEGCHGDWYLTGDHVAGNVPIPDPTE